ncbi:MAG: DUF502 domain-containing protein [Deltaproteobacteria bacterium]|nr:DUF502 domain-containing protein [Deltaproteobacteria bacterium]
MRTELKKSFITGIFVMVPLLLSVAILVWFFQKVDSFFSPPIDGIVRVVIPGATHIPGTGILTGLLIILLVGLFARNVVGARVLAGIDWLIDRIPGYRTVYTTIKQLTNAFSPESTRSFRQVLLVEYPKEDSYALGFRTGTVEKDGKPLAVVFVPTNNLYLGEVLYIPEEKAHVLDLTVEQGVKILVSGGIAAPKTFDRPASLRKGEPVPPR